MGFIKEFKEFAVRGSVIDLAVGVIIGAAFNGIVQSLVNDMVMPPIGVLLGNVDFTDLYVVLKQGATIAGPYATLDAAKKAGAVTLNIGVFINTIVNFLIVAFAIFLMVRYMNRLRRPVKAAEPVAPSTRKCPYCVTDISIEAKRCPNCTSNLLAEVA